MSVYESSTAEREFSCPNELSRSCFDDINQQIEYFVNKGKIEDISSTFSKCQIFSLGAVYLEIGISCLHKKLFNLYIMYVIVF